jgi:hypothetical protein
MFLLIALFFSLLLFAQEEAPIEEKYPEETTIEEEIPKDEVVTEPAECVCPQEEEVVDTLFPPNSVFLITPFPEPQEQAEEAPKKDFIPGYSDESYKQIPSD